MVTDVILSEILGGLTCIVFVASIKMFTYTDTKQQMYSLLCAQYNNSSRQQPLGLVKFLLFTRFNDSPASLD